MKARPKHRRFVVRFLTGDTDAPSQARCIHFGERHCADWRCPRHRPDSYADSMARHATDSLPSKGPLQ